VLAKLNQQQQAAVFSMVRDVADFVATCPGRIYQKRRESSLTAMNSYLQTFHGTPQTSASG